MRMFDYVGALALGGILSITCYRVAVSELAGIGGNLLPIFAAMTAGTLFGLALWPIVVWRKKRQSQR